MSVEVVTPEEYMGDIIGDLNKRRGQVSGMEQKGNARAIKAKVPLSEMFGYVTVLRTLSSGSCDVLHGVLALRGGTRQHRQGDYREECRTPERRGDTLYRQFE